MPGFEDYRNSDLLNVEPFRLLNVTKEDGGKDVHLLDSHGVVVAGNELETSAYVDGLSCGAITDDYKTWSENGCSPEYGKPVWLKEGVVVFDDNIHPSPNESIVSLRVWEPDGQGAPGWGFVGGEEQILMEGVHMIRVLTLKAAVDGMYYVRELERCERAWD